MEDKKKFEPNPKLKLMDQVRETLRYYHYAYRTEQTYCEWIRDYLKFFQFEKHPRDMGESEVERYLSFLASERKVAASTQRQALNAVMFLYRDVLNVELGKIAPMRNRRNRKPPTVLTQREVQLVIREMEGTHRLMARLTYGCGLRLMECIRLRVQDVDFGHMKLYVRDGKGGKDRVVILPDVLKPDLEEHVTKVLDLHRKDLNEGYGCVYIPDALSRKFPNATSEPGWQYAFPAKRRSVDPRSGQVRRHHVLESGFQKAVKIAVDKAGIIKRVTVHTLRHSYATHLLENGTNIRMVQELMGHANVKTTEIYTHVMERDLNQVRSPLDGL